MKENTLIKIGGISLVETVYGEHNKDLDFQWINESNYCMFSDEDREASISRETAIELINQLKGHFSITDEGE